MSLWKPIGGIMDATKYIRVSYLGTAFHRFPMLCPKQVASFVVPSLVDRRVNARDGFARSRLIFDYRPLGADDEK